MNLSDRRIRGKSEGSEGHREDHGYYCEPRGVTGGGEQISDMI